MTRIRRVEVSSEQEIQAALIESQRGGHKTFVRCIAQANSPEMEWLTRCEREAKNRSSTNGSPTSAASLLLLDVNKYKRCVSFDAEQRRVTFEAGVQLKDFHSYIHQRGLAVRGAVNGSSETSLGGMLCTASQVGSARYSLYDDILEIRLVLADGSIRTFGKADDDFAGVFCSLGLMGIISTVTLQLVPAFMCSGTRRRISFDGMLAQISATSLADHDYIAFEWYPHAGHQVLESAQDIVDPQDTEFMEAGVDVKPPINITAFDAQMAKILLRLAVAVPILATLADHVFVFDFRFRMYFSYLQSLIAVYYAKFLSLLGGRRHMRHQQRLARALYLKGAPNAYRFYGNWLTTIPNDKDLSMLRIHYTEIVIPMTCVSSYLRAVRTRLFETGQARLPMCPIAVDPIPVAAGWIAKNSAGGFAASDLSAGLSYITVIYSSYEAAGVEDVIPLFRPYWDLAEEMFKGKQGYKCHWGKVMDPALDLPGLAAMFGEQNWEAWLKLRQTLDPHGVFLADNFAAWHGLDCEGKGPNSFQLGRMLRAAKRSSRRSLKLVKFDKPPYFLNRHADLKLKE